MLSLQVSKLETPTSKDVKHIDRKLKSCLDPGSHDKYCSTASNNLRFYSSSSLWAAQETTAHGETDECANIHF